VTWSWLADCCTKSSERSGWSPTEELRTAGRYVLLLVRRITDNQMHLYRTSVHCCMKVGCTSCALDENSAVSTRPHITVAASDIQKLSGTISLCRTLLKPASICWPANAMRDIHRRVCTDHRHDSAWMTLQQCYKTSNTLAASLTVTDTHHHTLLWHC